METDKKGISRTQGWVIVALLAVVALVVIASSDLVQYMVWERATRIDDVVSVTTP